MENTQQLTTQPPQELEEIENDQTQEETYKLNYVKGDLTLQKFKRAYIKTGNATKAYQELYPNTSYGSAATLGSKLLKKVDMNDLFEEMGLTDVQIARNVENGTKAMKKLQKRVLKYMDAVPDPKDSTKVRAVEVVEFQYIDVPDEKERRENNELAAKLKKKLTDTKQEITVGEMNVNIVNYANEAPTQNTIDSSQTTQSTSLD